MLFDFKLILILILCIVIYFLYNKNIKLKSKNEKLEVNNKELKEGKNTENKEEYLENFYGSGDSDTEINNLSQLDETTEIHENYENSGFQNNSIENEYSESNSTNAFKTSHNLELDSNNINTINDESIKEFFDHPSSPSSFDQKVKEAFDDDDNTTDIKVNLDEVVDDRDNEIRNLMGSVADSKPSDNLINDDDNFDYDDSDSEAEPIEEELEFDTASMGESKSTSTQEDIPKKSNSKSKNIISVDLDLPDDLTGEDASNNEEIDSDLEELDQLSAKLEENTQNPELDSNEDKSVKSEKAMLANIRYMINYESMTKYKLGQLQDFAKNLDIEIEKSQNGKIRNKTKVELWKDIKNNIQSK